MSRWDHPKPPKDWRYWVGGTGRVLITVGLLMFAFVAYQLWGTGIQTARAQDRLDRQFERAVQANGAVASNTPPGGDASAASSAGAPVGSLGVPAGSTPAESPASGAPSPGGGLTGLGLGLYDAPPAGNAVAKLVIPRLDLDWTVVQGVARNDLKQGPGHFPESPMPGEFGNMAIAGHRTTWGEPFADLDQLQPGDDLYLTDLGGLRYHYRIVETVIVGPRDYPLLVPAIDTTKVSVTLITCHPRYSTRQRLAVRAELVAADSPEPRQPRFHLPPSGGTSELPGEDFGDPAGPAVVDSATLPTMAGTSTTPPSGASAVPRRTAGGSSSGGSAAGQSSARAPVAGSSAAGTPTGTVPNSSIVTTSRDALSAGWFSDPAAWPHVLLWGAALTGWYTLCHRLARRRRQIWIGVLIGVGPFFVLLYLWFENVNRLLPPNL